MKGFTGKQGVMIPAQNVQNLMLKQEIIDAVVAGQFHIWAVNHIDEGLEILTGIPAGQQLEDGSWPEGTVNYMVNERLERMVEGLQKFARGKESNDKE